jgi:hypothetical protein
MQRAGLRQGARFQLSARLKVGEGNHEHGLRDSALGQTVSPRDRGTAVMATLLSQFHNGIALGASQFVEAVHAKLPFDRSLDVLAITRTPYCELDSEPRSRARGPLRQPVDWGYANDLLRSQAAIVKVERSMSKVDNR